MTNARAREYKISKSRSIAVPRIKTRVLWNPRCSYFRSRVRALLQSVHEYGCARVCVCAWVADLYAGDSFALKFKSDGDGDIYTVVEKVGAVMIVFYV